MDTDARIATPESRAAIEDWHDERPLIRGIGAITPPRRYPHTKPRTRTVGVAAFSEDPAHIARLADRDVNATVRVIRPGMPDEIVPQSHFSRTRDTQRRTPAHPAQMVDTARFEIKGMDWSA